MIRALLLMIGILGVHCAHGARDYITVVGSSTVFPFAAVTAERFGKSTSYSTPKIEATGSGGGFKLFCSGVGVRTPDVSNASRRISSSEFERCQENGVTEIGEILIGYDGIALARSAEEVSFNLSLNELYLGLAKWVPGRRGNSIFVLNPYKSWRDISPRLPDIPILVYGPPATSGTRDAFLERVMDRACLDFQGEPAECRQLREDGAYINTGENDGLIIQKLRNEPMAIGILGYSVTKQYRDLVSPLKVDGVSPSDSTITSGEYPISRPLYLYVKLAHLSAIPGIREFMKEMVSERAIGEFGYLLDKGIIPASPERRRYERRKVDHLSPMQLDAPSANPSNATIPSNATMSDY